jgi:anti-sigma factor RsiW
MKSCRSFAKLLPLQASGDLSFRRAAVLEAHLEGCPACRGVLAQYDAIRTAARGAFSMESQLPEATITRIAHRAAAEPRTWRSASWVPSWSLQPSFGHALTALAPVALVTVLAVLPVIRAHRNPEATAQVPDKLEVRMDGDTVRLAWSDGRGKPYKVFKSSDPRLLGQGQGQEVRGNQWVDRTAGASEVVFYRVE